MKYFLGTLLILLLAGCDTTRTRQLDEKEKMLQQKEQELLVREQALQLKEQELMIRQARLDSIFPKDTLPHFDSTLIGTWDVTMVCTSTNCAGSAVGDTKTETWEITSDGKQYLATAYTGGVANRLYKGIYTGNTLELVAQPSGTRPEASIVARLHSVKPGRLEGEREISRNDGCKTIYTMGMDKIIKK